MKSVEYKCERIRRWLTKRTYSTYELGISSYKLSCDIISNQ